jgi:MFS family permease
VTRADPQPALTLPVTAAPLGVAPAGRWGPWFEQHRFLIVFALLASFMGVSVGMAQITTSLYALQLAASATQLGLIAGAQSIGVLFMSLPIGVLVDRLGPRRPFLAGTLVVGLLYATVPLVASPLGLLLCTALISFAMPMRFVSLNTVFLAQLASLGESKAGWYRGTHMLGMLLVGPMLGASLVSSLGVAWAYRTIAGLFFVTILLSPIVFGRYGGRPAASRAIGWHALRAQLALLVRDREVRRISLLESLTQATGYFFTFFIVVVALQRADLGASEASSLISAKGITYIAALFLLGGSVQRLGPRRSKLASFSAIALGLLAMGAGSNPVWLWIGSLALGLGLGTIQIATLTRYAQIGARNGHGKASGLNALAGPSGGVFGTSIGGVLGNWLGLGNVFLLIGAGFVLATAVVYVSRHEGELV